MKVNIQKHGIEIQRNFVSSSVIKTIKDEVENSNKIESKYGIRSANKKFKALKN